MDGSCCWLSPGMLAMPTMPYYVAVSGAKLPTVSDWSNTKTRHGEKWPCTHRSPPGRLAWRERHRPGGAPAAATERLRYWAASGYLCLLQVVLVCMDVVSAGLPLHNDSLLPCHLLPAGLGQVGEEGQALLLPLPALAAAQALSLLPLCAAHGGWRCLGKHLGMDSSFSTSGSSLWALPGC